MFVYFLYIKYAEFNEKDWMIYIFMQYIMLAHYPIT